MERISVLQRYRSDRRKLLEFLLSSGLIREIRTPAGGSTSLSDINVDILSADYVIQCVNSGGVIDISEATEKYYSETSYPVMMHSKSQNSYYLVSHRDSGSPPRRMPPSVSVDTGQTSNRSTYASSKLDPLVIESRFTHGVDRSLKHDGATPVKSEGTDSLVPLGLPRLKTGLTDDDLRETAYEILLASLFFIGVEIHSADDRKKEKSSRFLSGLKGKREKSHHRTFTIDRHGGIINIIRVQMQISEAMHACTKRALEPLVTKKTHGHIDFPQTFLGLLNGIFKSDFSSEKLYLHWKSRQACILEELFDKSVDLTATEHQTIESSVAKIRNAEEWEEMMSTSERLGVLLDIRQVAAKLSSLPGKFGIQSETYYWTTAYHLNIRLYEKLLFAIFDILDEGQLIAEADEILTLVRLTWPALGITQKVHDAIYVWVLFQQFAITGEAMLLDYTILELKKVLSAEDDNEKERQYMSSLVCLRKYKGKKIKLTLLQAITHSISIWCDNKLQDYHLHFGQNPGNFKKVITLAIDLHTSSINDKIETTKLNSSSEAAASKLKTYVKRSIEAAYMRVMSYIDLETRDKKAHTLALLAKELMLIAEREFGSFFPVLRRWCTEAGVVSAMLLHQFFGERLKPFLEDVSCLSEDVKAVLVGAYKLDRDLTRLYYCALEDTEAHHHWSLEHYQIKEVSKPIILEWVISQHSHILEWTGRAFDLEDWEPLSLHQRQATSIIEVFRIIEETVDQFFGLNLPMDITHLQALLSLVYNSLDGYLIKLLDQLVGKNYLYPSVPPLTRYTETLIPVMRKKVYRCSLPDDNVKTKLNKLTVSKLCIRLNTLQFIQKQLGMLEDGIRKSWEHVQPSFGQRREKEQNLGSWGRDLETCGEAIDDLFLTTFDAIRDRSSDAISQICDFTGAKFVFWDMREVFIYQLYRGNVEAARLDSIFPHVDAVLDRICGLVDDDLRDCVVLSIFQASLEGYVWVLLEGGPSRAFAESDVMMMEEDLDLLKEFFVADGEGLPRSLVDREAKFAEMILSLFSLQSESLIEMLLTASKNISADLESTKHVRMCVEDAHTLIRVLCHKKDREASKYLKRQYQLPMSSEYDDTLIDPTLGSPPVSDHHKRSTPFRWTNQGQASFKFNPMRSNMEETTSAIQHGAR